MTDTPVDVTRAVRTGTRLFNLGRYLAASQAWEAVWSGASPEDRGFLEGLIQLAAGLHLRTRRGATRGAVHLLSQALVLLEDYRPAMHGVDVGRLVEDFTDFVQWLREVNRPYRLLDRLRVPRIRRT